MKLFSNEVEVNDSVPKNEIWIIDPKQFEELLFKVREQDNDYNTRTS